jgi:hypothetical protein
MPMIVSSGKSMATRSSVIGRPTLASRIVRAIDQAMADLHHDRNAEFGAARVVGIVDRRIRRLAEPVRVEMRADEAEFAHGAIELLQARDAAQRIDSGEPRKAVRVGAAGLVHIFVGDLCRGAHAPVAAARGDQQRALDSGAIHLLDVLLRRQAAPVFGRSMRT